LGGTGFAGIVPTEHLRDRQVKGNSREAITMNSVASSMRAAAYARVSVPALAFFVLYDAAYVTPQMEDGARATNELAFRVLDASGYKREQIDLFRRTVRHGRVIEWDDTNHMFFDDPKHSDETVRTIRGFLSDLPR
jgi:hypothetical protein